MTNDAERGQPTPRPRKPSVPQTVFKPVRHVLNRFLSLLVPRDWSRSTLKDIMNNDERQSELIGTYIECELAKMNTTGVTVRPCLSRLLSAWD